MQRPEPIVRESPFEKRAIPAFEEERPRVPDRAPMQREEIPVTPVQTVKSDAPDDGYDIPPFIRRKMM
jgi:hypothetical protein